MLIKCRDLQTTEKYYVDTSTNNESFIKVALLLKAKGVNNCFFHLKIYNKKVAGLDPFSTKLTDDQKILIFQEAKDNKFYFIRECFRLPGAGADPNVPGSGVKFKLNRGNLAYFWARSFSLSLYMVLPRQIGKTWSVLSDWTHEYFAYKNANMLHFNKSQTDANDNISNIKRALELLPPYMQHSNIALLKSEDKRRVKNNERELRSRYNTRILAMASATNKTKADTLARGKTVEKLWFDEFAFQLFNDIVYSSAMPAFNTASKNAKAAGIPYGIILTTTPGDLCSAHGAFAFKMKETCIQFSEGMYDLPINELMDIMENTPDRINMLYIEFQYYQVGEDDAWLETARKKSTDPISFRREFLLEWINTNGKSPFDADDIDYIIRIADERKDNYYEISINKYFKLKVYSEYTGTKPVLISVDVGGGGGADGSSVVVVNPDTLKPMAFFSSNLISSYHLKRLLIALVQKIYPNSILTIESNYVGSAILEELAESPIRRNLYKEKRKTKKDSGSAVSINGGVSDIVYGHRVTSASRPQMMDMLSEMVQHNKEYLAYPELINEIKHLELKGGRIDHGSATHDDSIFAYFGALYVVKYGTGLKNTGIYFNVGLDEDDTSHNSTSANLRLLDLAVRRNRNDETSLDAQASDINKFLGKTHSTMTGGEYLDGWNREQDERRLGYTDENSSGVNHSRLNQILSKNLNYSLEKMFGDDEGKDMFDDEGQSSGWFNKYRGR